MKTEEKYFENRIKYVAHFHKLYSKQFLSERIKDKDLYLNDPKESLFWIFSSCFYQGRRDEISREFEKRAKLAFNDYYSNNQKIFFESNDRIIAKDHLLEKYSYLEELLKKYKVNKSADRLMVLSLLNYVQSTSKGNIVAHIINQIKNNSINVAHQKLDEIWSIGNKIASLILRDLVFIYSLEKYLKKKDYYYLQPIDTWVHKVAFKLKIIENNSIYNGENSDIANKCFEVNVNPIHFNQGAWYIGTQALNILLDNIESIKVKQAE